MRTRRTHSHQGYTLIELMVVILLMAMLASVAMPRLLPLITLTEHQNEARHLVGYGRAAMAHAAMAHENIIVRIDLDRQEYWVEKQPDVYSESEETEADLYAEDDDWIPDDEGELQEASRTILKAEPQDQEYRDPEEQDKVLARQKENMQKSFTSMAQNSLFARAKRVQHDRDELFEDDDMFKREEEEEDEFQDDPSARAVNSSLLQSHAVIESVFLDSVQIGEEIFKKGIVEVELTPLGLSTEINFLLINEENDLLIVHWDPLTGSAWYTEAEAEDKT